jgi:hypothetical protein
MRRWFLLAVPLLVLLASGLWLSWGSYRTAKADFAAITEGMTIQEVNALLRPRFHEEAGIDSCSGVLVVFYIDQAKSDLMPANTIRIRFDDGKVRYKDFQPWTFADLITRLRYRLGL